MSVDKNFTLHHIVIKKFFFTQNKNKKRSKIDRKDNNAGLPFRDI